MPLPHPSSLLPPYDDDNFMCLLRVASLMVLFCDVCVISSSVFFIFCFFGVCVCVSGGFNMFTSRSVEVETARWVVSALAGTW